MKSSNLLLVFVFMLLPFALFASRANKQPVTMNKVTGSLIDYMKEYDRVSEENVKLREKYETMPAQTWFVINETGVSLKLSSEGKTLLSLSADATFSPALSMDSKVSKGSEAVVALDAKKVLITLEPGQTYGSDPTVYVDYLIGREAWLLHVQ